MTSTLALARRPGLAMSRWLAHLVRRHAARVTFVTERGATHVVLRAPEEQHARAHAALRATLAGSGLLAVRSLDHVLREPKRRAP